ncbi:major facilitator superfamily domain-containing protein [Amylocystis lapponica]|nr:major facilitator superfamily domain-containing protein [Amylocystis lapponica]
MAAADNNSVAETILVEQAATENQPDHEQEQHIKADISSNRPYSVYTPSEKWFIPVYIEHIFPGYSNPLKLFLYPDITLLLAYNSILYSLFYGVTTSISTLFHQTYPFLNETEIGLCVLAIGGGMLFGGVITGKVLDREYKRVKDAMIRDTEKETDPEKRIAPEDVTKDEYFPIEQARLRLLPVFFGVFVAGCVGYGWTLEKKVSIAGPLVLQIILGYTSVSCMNITQTLIIDLVPSQSSAVTACNNLTRCTLGAGLVSIIDLILNAIGTGWTYVLLAGICVFFSPLMVVTRYMGPKWRARRRARRAAASVS